VEQRNIRYLLSDILYLISNMFWYQTSDGQYVAGSQAIDAITPFGAFKGAIHTDLTSATRQALKLTKISDI
jgi:hypothetical protein